MANAPCPLQWLRGPIASGPVMFPVSCVWQPSPRGQNATAFIRDEPHALKIPEPLIKRSQRQSERACYLWAASICRNSPPSSAARKLLSCCCTDARNWSRAEKLPRLRLRSPGTVLGLRHARRRTGLPTRLSAEAAIPSAVPREGRACRFSRSPCQAGMFSGVSCSPPSPGVQVTGHLPRLAVANFPEQIGGGWVGGGVLNRWMQRG